MVTLKWVSHQQHKMRELSEWLCWYFHEDNPHTCPPGHQSGIRKCRIFMKALFADTNLQEGSRDKNRNYIVIIQNWFLVLAKRKILSKAKHLEPQAHFGPLWHIASARQISSHRSGQKYQLLPGHHWWRLLWTTKIEWLNVYLILYIYLIPEITHSF